MGTLYVIGTPIGNLEDLGHRAQRVIGSVGTVIAEDTRHTRRLLTRYGVSVRLESFHAHSQAAQRDALVARLAHEDAALVTDAGTPGISDPGAELVRAAVLAGHAVVPVPGPSAVATALSVAAMPADAYTFLGFLPRQAAARRKALAAYRDGAPTLVLFEAPHRLRATLDDLAGVLGDREVAVCRELTKVHEEIWRGTLSGAAAEWAARPPRGEFTLVVAGAAPSAEIWDAPRVQAALDARRAAGAGRRDAAREIALAAGWPSREVYRLWESTP